MASTGEIQGLAGAMIGIVASSGILMITIVCARAYTRLIVHKKHFGWDDWIMVLAAILGTALWILTCCMTIYGAGHHTIPAEWIIPYRKMVYASEMLNPTCLALTKISICFTYLQVFVSRLDTHFSYTSIVLLTMWGISTVMQAVFYCAPIKAFWDFSVPHFTCINYYVSLMILMGFNSLMDILVFLWPAKSIITLQLPRTQKISLIVAFGLGCLVSVVGITRCVYLSIYLRNRDNYLGAVVLILNALEVNMGIFCGSIPSLRSLLIFYFPSLNTTNRSRTMSGSKGLSKSGRLKSGRSNSFPFQVLNDHNSNFTSSKANETVITTVTSGHDKMDEQEIQERIIAERVIHYTRAIEITTERPDTKAHVEMSDRDSEELILQATKD